ncbi:MAG TPA: O-antigen ligase family protein [Methylophilaceae bacterium]
MSRIIAQTPAISRHPAMFAIVGMLVALGMGALVSLYAATAGDKYGVLLALPGAMIIGLLFVFDRNTFFYLVILLRAIMDPIFDATKLGGFGLGAVLNALIILLAAIALLEKPMPAGKLFKQTWLAFLVISLISLAYAPEFVPALKTYLGLVSYAAVFMLAVTLVKDEESYGRWMRAVFFSSFIPVVYGFIDAATGGFKSEDVGFRISSTFSHPNIFAFYLVLIISISFYFFKVKASYIPASIRRLIPVYILTMLVLLVMTKTRSAWISCMAFFLVYALLYERKYLLYLMLVPLAAFFVPEIRDRILDLTQGNQVINYSRLNSYAWRKLIWHDGLTWMQPSHYFMGYGLEAFKHYSLDFFSMAGVKESGAHSVFVQLFFETGALGLGAFIWLHYKVGRELMVFYRQNKLMIFCAVMFLLEFALDAYSDNMLAYLCFNWYLWFVLGAAYAVNYHSRQHKEASP